MEGSNFVTGVTLTATAEKYRDTFFIYTGTLPENCFIEAGRGMETSALRHGLLLFKDRLEKDLADKTGHAVPFIFWLMCWKWQMSAGVER